MIDHKQQKTQVIRFCYLFVFLSIESALLSPILFSFIGYADSLNFPALFCHVFINIFYFLYPLQFILVSFAVRSRFRAINQHIELGLKTDRDKFLLAFGKLFHRLCDVIELINQTVTLPLISTFTITLVTLVLNSFFSISSFNLFQVSVIFTAFGLISELLHSTTHFYSVLILDCTGISHQLLVVVGVICAGSYTTKEAENTKIIIGKVISETVLNDSEKINFMYLMSQLRSRNLNLENVLFKINWNVLLTVSRSITFN